MNVRLLFLIGLSMMVTSLLLDADEPAIQDYVNKFYAQWSTPRQRSDDGAGMMIANFHHEVPASAQIDVLDQIFDRAFFSSPKNYRAMGFVMMCLKQSGANVALPARLNTELIALAKDDSNWLARRDVLHVLAKLNRPQDHDLIAAALNDPQDEVREAAIDALRGQPDAEATLQKFIQDHQSDSAYRTSVLYAKSGLDAIHEKAHGQ